MSLSLMEGHYQIEFVASERLRKTFSVHFFAQYFTCFYKTTFIYFHVRRGDFRRAGTHPCYYIVTCYNGFGIR